MQPCRDRERRRPPCRSVRHRDLTLGADDVDGMECGPRQPARPVPNGEIRGDWTVPSVTIFGPKRSGGVPPSPITATTSDGRLTDIILAPASSGHRVWKSEETSWRQLDGRVVT